MGQASEYLMSSLPILPSPIRQALSESFFIESRNQDSFPIMKCRRLGSKSLSREHKRLRKHRRQTGLTNRKRAKPTGPSEAA